MKNIAFIGIGSNTGDREKACLDAIAAIASWPGCSAMTASSLYESEPWGYTEQGMFINCAVKMETRADAFTLFAFLQETELRMGKEKSFLWGPRTIDLDLLFFNQEVIDAPGLKVPHPFLHQRRFVLEPLSELAPAWMHPVLNQPVQQLLQQQVVDTKKVVKLPARRARLPAK
jgi:2-amino-4-hydroxy-6-hydroxymethyldihydropteridine diphosphokinase